MKTYATFALLFLLGCSSSNPEPTPVLSDAGVSPEAAADAGVLIDRYWYACCPFAEEGFAEYQPCCDAWRDAGSPMTEYQP